MRGINFSGSLSAEHPTHILFLLNSNNGAYFFLSIKTTHRQIDVGLKYANQKHVCYLSQ